MSSLMLSDDDDDFILSNPGPSGASNAKKEDLRHAGERVNLLGDSDDDEEDADFFLTGPKVGKETGKLAGLQKQVQEVTDVMRDNVNRIMDRGERLDELQMRSSHLEDAATEFRSGSREVRRKVWWQNTKAKLIAGISGAIGVIILVIIIFS